MTYENGPRPQPLDACSTGPDRRITLMANLTRASLTTRRALAQRRRQGEPRRRRSNRIRRLLAQLLERACVALLADGIRNLWARAAEVDWIALVEKIAAAIFSVFS